MTPEPKDVQLARLTMSAIGICDSSRGEQAFAMAKKILDAHEANLEVGRKQAEERQRAIDETARRWPELAGKWSYKEIHGYHEFTNSRGGEVLSIDSSSSPDVSFDSAENGESRPVPVVLALIDAAGRNTTAERLRDDIVSALSVLWKSTDLEACRVDVSKALNDALESETWTR